MSKRIVKVAIMILSVFILSAFKMDAYADDTELIVDDPCGFADYTEYYGYEADGGTAPILYNPIGRSTTQQLKYIAVFVEFPDADMQDIHLDSDDIVNRAYNFFNSGEGTVTGLGGSKVEVTSLKEYLERESYQKLSVEAEIFPKAANSTKVVSYQSTKNRKYYMQYDAASNPEGYQSSGEASKRELELINEVVGAVKAQIEASGITSEEIDANHDGCIDAISFFVEAKAAGTDEVGWGQLLWSHKVSIVGGPSILGKTVRTYNLINTYDSSSKATGGVFSENRPTYATIIHEYMHTAGFPDLYRYSYNGTPVGFYDLMADTNSCNPQGLLTALTAEYLNTGWHNKLPEYNASASNITLKKPEYMDPSENRAVKVVSPVNPEEYFIIEYYNRHSSLPTSDSSGIIVYRVNDTYKWDGNKLGGTAYDDDYIFIFRPNETALSAGGGNLEKATLNSTRKKWGKSFAEASSGFDNNTVYYSDGSNSGIVIDVVNSGKDYVTFNLTVPSVNGSGTKNDPYLISTPEEFMSVINGHVGNYFKLTADLDFSSVQYTGVVLDGHVDGNNKTLSNIQVSDSGVFDAIGNRSRSSVKNLNIKDIRVSSSGNVQNHMGAFASELVNGEITNVVVLSGTVSNIKGSSGSILGTGGFAGTVHGRSSIRNCGTSADVLSGYYVGGFIGLLQGTPVVSACYSNGSITTGAGTTGGFVGYEYDVSAYNFSDCYYDMKKAALQQSFPGKNRNGITGCRLENIELTPEISSSRIQVTTSPDKNISWKDLSIEDGNIVYYDAKSGKILANTAGQTRFQVGIPVGSNTMPLAATCINSHAGKAYTVSIEGVTWLIRSDRIDVGAAYDSNDELTQFRWQSYNLSTGKWETISDWGKGNWASWYPEKGNYWLHVEARTQDGNVDSETICFAVDRNYVKGYTVDIRGLTWIFRSDKIDVGAAYDSNDPQVKFQWKSYNLDTGKWEVIADWSKGNWASWYPKRGNYWLHVEAVTQDGRTDSETICFAVDRDYSNSPYINIRGLTWIFQSDRIDVGAAYDSNDPQAEFQWKSYNLDTGKWELISGWYKGNWTSWRPKAGNYWLYVEARTSDGSLDSEVICFAVDRDYY